jgi:hypothetical protein
VTIAVVLSITGCSMFGGSPTETPSATPTPTATTALEYLPDGNAFDNKSYFDQVLRPVAEAGQKTPGRAMVSALVAAGFDRHAISLTPDLTRTGLDADSVFVAVRIDTLCLIGQRTNSKNFYSSVESELKIGSCLIGNTSK